MSPSQRLVLDYWYRLLPPEGLPLRQQFDPLEVWSAIAKVILLEIVGEGEDLIFRLIGQEFEERARFGLRGQRFTDVGNPARVPQILDAVRDMYHDPRPILSAGSLATMDRDFISYRRLALAFASTEGGPASHILCCYDFNS